MRTDFALLAVYESVLIPVATFAEDVMGIRPQTAKNQIASGTFPVKVTKLGTRSMIHIDDAARYIDECRQAAEAS